MPNLFVAAFLLTGTAYAMGAPAWVMALAYLPLLAALWLARRA